MDPRPDAPKVVDSACRYWRDRALGRGPIRATIDLIRVLWEFARDSTPWRLRQRYGDADYDWDFRVNTSSAAVGWHDRLLGVFHSPYQPTEPALFREMVDALQALTNLRFADFSFIDLGSGKGRTLLMASDYPFHGIVGVELLPALHRIAQQNLAHYTSHSQKCFALESICGDATGFHFPDGPMLIYLFNPLPESGLRHTLANLARDLALRPRPVYVLYHNPLWEGLLLGGGGWSKLGGTHQYSIFRFAPLSSAARENR
jgi:SAM-dependent methyltransferase